MSFGPRHTTLPSHIRPSSGLGTSANSQSSILQNRINEKKLELESLRQLRDLSAGLAGQMQQLEEKLSTLSDGTEAVAAVMGNWGHVLRAVAMASGTCTWASMRSGTCANKEDVQPRYRSPRMTRQRRRPHRCRRRWSGYLSSRPKLRNGSRRRRLRLVLDERAVILDKVIL